MRRRFKVAKHKYGNDSDARKPIRTQDIFLETILGRIKEQGVITGHLKTESMMDTIFPPQNIEIDERTQHTSYSSFKADLEELLRDVKNTYYRCRKNADIRVEILKLLPSTEKIRNSAMEILKLLPITERMRLLFDHWAENDNYGKAMKQHTRAIREAVSRIPDNLIPASFSLDPKNAGRKKRSIVIFDPFVGNGDVISTILKIAALQHSRVTSKKPLKINLYINDISPNMIKLARAKLNKSAFLKTLKEYNVFFEGIFSSQINFLDDEERAKNLESIGLLPSSVDLAIVSQTLDLLKGIETKNKVLTLLHDYLKIGGNLVVIGEDPDRFTLSDEMDIISALLFETVFEPFGKNETDAELKRIRNGRLMIIGESSEKIDDKHSAFVRVAQRIYRPSELGEVQAAEPAQSNGKPGN